MVKLTIPGEVVDTIILLLKNIVVCVSYYATGFIKNIESKYT